MCAFSLREATAEANTASILAQQLLQQHQVSLTAFKRYRVPSMMNQTPLIYSNNPLNVPFSTLHPSPSLIARL
jgi:hypothetical protein